MEAIFKLPYLKKLEDVDDFTVWQVDGEYIRNNIDREFTNFGQHYRFKFIPKNEFWVDREYSPGEMHYFVLHLLKEWELMDKGASYEEALEKADAREKRERLKEDFIKKISEKAEEGKAIPKELYVKKIDKYSKNLSVWIIKGELVRALYFIDFTEGGHHYVYSFVPEDEIWIDDDLSVEEREFVILHEVHERFLMKGGMRYQNAHRSSSILEYKYRKNPTNVEKAIFEEIDKNLKE